MGRKKDVSPWDTDVFTPEAIAAAQHILAQKTEDDYGRVFNEAEHAQEAAWANGDVAAQEHWRLVFSAYTKLSPRTVKWETEYHNSMTAAMLAYPGDPRTNPEASDDGDDWRSEYAHEPSDSGNDWRSEPEAD